MTNSMKTALKTAHEHLDPQVDAMVIATGTTEATELLSYEDVMFLIPLLSKHESWMRDYKASFERECASHFVNGHRP